MDWKKEWKPLTFIAGVFIAAFFLPIGNFRFDNAVRESLHLIKWYAREHVLLCLIPAFFIAGAISVFVKQEAVMKYLGAKANKILAYGVASVSGTILAVCSCTVLPLFNGIYRMGAGLGPAIAFLYSGPAINVLAIILTARILGLEIGIARAVGAVVFSIVIGLAMHFIFIKEEKERVDAQMAMPDVKVDRPLWQNVIYFALMVGILVFVNWGAPNEFYFKLKDGREFRAAVTQAPEDSSAKGAVFKLKPFTDGVKAPEITVSAEQIVEKKAVPNIWTSIWKHKWHITALLAAMFGGVLALWFKIEWWKLAIAGTVPLILAFVLPSGGLWILLPFTAGTIGLAVITSTKKGEAADWFTGTWDFAKQILPLLFFGVLVAGFLLGRPNHESLIPGKYVEMLVGNSPELFLTITGLGAWSFAGFIRSLWPVLTNLFASIFGAFMYFATLTEVPILQGLIGAGMGKGPALALLLAGPALSLPNMLVIRSVLGTKKTIVFVLLVVVMATISGIIFGTLF